MKSNLYVSILIICFLSFARMSLYGSESFIPDGPKSKNRSSVKDSLSWSVSLMKRVFNGSGEWFMTSDSFQNSVKGVIDYAENDPVDTVVVDMNHLLRTDSIPLIFNRRPENIPVKSLVPGYISADDLDRQVEARRKQVTDSILISVVIVPDDYLAEGLSKAPVVPPGEPKKMLPDMERTLPGAFVNRYRKGLVDIILPANVTEDEIDTLKTRLFNSTRQFYNDSVLFSQRDFLIQTYKENFMARLTNEEATKKSNFLSSKNREILDNFNEAEVRKVNDSVRIALRYLTNHAAADSTLITVTNRSGYQARTWTANRPMVPTRIFLKNEQNDSVSVVLYNNGKGGVKMVIDDGVKFLRMAETQKKEIIFDQKKPDGKLQNIYLKPFDPLPWTLYGTGAVGFTQTALSNWAKGGESSLSLLLIGRYVANYSKKYVKWENNAEFRLGIFNSKTRGLEKNDDKLEIQSRLGISAFKKWYYSGETNFRTQIAKGYKYPDKDNPISKFMAPGYLTFSVGMDYKPNKNFSLFLSPFTSKTTYVRDTVLIDPSHYGLEPGKTSLWEPGIITKLNWHYLIRENIIYDTRAEIFSNYVYPFKKYNIFWEQTLVLQLTQYISTRINTQMVYDYNTKFPVMDSSGNEIDKKAKWQFKELFTVGFNYKF